MRFQHTLVDFADLDSMSQDTEESEAFKAKFKPKKTTDDVYTPPAVYDAVARWVFDKYALPEDTVVVRPFYPGGDFATHDYPEGCLVLDNPPFSIMHRIVRFYTSNRVPFFLFANALTLFQQIGLCNCVVVGADVTFANGAKVGVSFLTSLGDNRIEVAGDLYDAIKAVDKARPKKVQTGYEFPPNATTGARLSTISHAGLCLSIREALPLSYLEPDCHVFGGGALIDDEAAAREAAAREAAAREAAARERIRLSLTAKDARRLDRLNAGRKEVERWSTRKTSWTPSTTAGRPRPRWRPRWSAPRAPGRTRPRSGRPSTSSGPRGWPRGAPAEAPRCGGASDGRDGRHLRAVPRRVGLLRRPRRGHHGQGEGEGEVADRGPLHLRAHGAQDRAGRQDRVQVGARQGRRRRRRREARPRHPPRALHRPPQHGRAVREDRQDAVVRQDRRRPAGAQGPRRPRGPRRVQGDGLEAGAMPTMEEILRACETWTTPREASERAGGCPRSVASQLKLAVRRGWAESRFEDGRGTVYRALPGWESLMEGRERAPMPSKPSPVKVAILRELSKGPMTAGEIADAIGSDLGKTASRLHSMRLQGLVESAPLPRAGRGGVRYIYTLRKTAYSQEDPGMGDRDEKSESKPPYPSKEAEECENDVRNEP